MMASQQPKEALTNEVHLRNPHDRVYVRRVLEERCVLLDFVVLPIEAVLREISECTDYFMFCMLRNLPGGNDRAEREQKGSLFLRRTEDVVVFLKAL